MAPAAADDLHRDAAWMPELELHLRPAGGSLTDGEQLYLRASAQTAVTGARLTRGLRAR